MANLDQRFAKIPKPKRPEEPRAILEDREDSRCDGLVQCSRRAHADKLQARSKFAVSRRVESASPPHVPRAPVPMRMLTISAPPMEETNARRFRQEERALVRVEIKTSPTRLPGKAR